MAKAAKPSKKKKAAVKKNIKKASPKKKAAKKVTKKVVKKAVRKAAPKKSFKRAASKPPMSSVETTTDGVPEEAVIVKPTCKCKEKKGLFFLMVKQKNGKFKESPMHAAFETLAECEANCIPE